MCHADFFMLFCELVIGDKCSYTASPPGGPITLPHRKTVIRKKNLTTKDIHTFRKYVYLCIAIISVMQNM